MATFLPQKVPRQGSYCNMLTFGYQGDSRGLKTPSRFFWSNHWSLIIPGLPRSMVSLHPLQFSWLLLHILGTQIIVPYHLVQKAQTWSPDTL